MSKHLKTILQLIVFIILSPIIILLVMVKKGILKKNEVPHLIGILFIIGLIISTFGNTEEKATIQLPNFMNPPQVKADTGEYKTEYNSKGEIHSPLKRSDDLYTFVLTHCDTETIRIYPDIIKMAKNASIKSEVLFAISWADTQCGKHLTTPNNYGNVGNNDRGNRVGYFTALEGWTAIAKTLNNKYISGIDNIGNLSGGGRLATGAIYNCSNAPSPYKCYATSLENWNKNTLRALRVINNDDSINEFYRIRLEGESNTITEKS